MTITVGAVLALSLLSAWFAEQVLTERIAVAGSFIGITLTHNRGIAFGISLPSPLQEILILTALWIVLVIALRSPQQRLTSIGFGMIIAGALGNLIDRIPDGLVTDFIQIGSFPVFNVADSAITIGVLLLLFDSFAPKRPSASHS